MCGSHQSFSLSFAVSAGQMKMVIYIWLDMSAPSISLAWFLRTLGSHSFWVMNVPVVQWGFWVRERCRRLMDYYFIFASGHAGLFRCGEIRFIDACVIDALIDNVMWCKFCVSYLRRGPCLGSTRCSWICLTQRGGRCGSGGGTRRKVILQFWESERMGMMMRDELQTWERHRSGRDRQTNKASIVLGFCFNVTMCEVGCWLPFWMI